ncbi:hypothetical protein [Verrucomicrobium spinosum]|uniref:hypothetical protein n=1 Tax=Verrucomicrobium spinosum TaxID=2736 RepID=UPI00155DB0E6|nr:hypothetical protein [Verrucomicrobium spinosum]
MEPLPRVKPLKEVRVTEGCLSTTKKAGIPDYGMSDLQRRALLLALKEVQGTAPQPRSTLQTVDAFLMKMNCYACHEWRGTGGLEEPRAQYLTVYEAAAHSLGELGRLPPKLDVAGRKLTDEWFAKLLWGTGGGVRSYMTTRMPRFGQDNCVGFLPASRSRPNRRSRLRSIPAVCSNTIVPNWDAGSWGWALAAWVVCPVTG